MGNKRSMFLVSVLCFGMAFLYIPLLSLIVYSFNYSKLVPVWGGFPCAGMACCSRVKRCGPR